MRACKLLVGMSALLLTLSGCIAYDPSISDQHPVAGGARLHGQFSCRPSYRSLELGFVGPPSLAEVFGRSDCQMATLDYSEQFGLMVSFEHGNVYDELFAIDRKPGLTTTQQGKFILTQHRGCVAAATGVGCGTQTVTLFLNQAGDLVVIENVGGAGLAGLVVPFAMIGHMMAIFPHWEG